MLCILSMSCFFIFCRKHRIHRKAAVINWKLQNHKGSHPVGSLVVLYSDPPNIFNCSARRHIYLLSLFTYVHFVEQNRCFVEVFTSQVLGLVGLLLDNETFIIVLKTQKLFVWMYFLPKNPQRRKYILGFSILLYIRKERIHTFFSKTITIWYVLFNSLTYN